MRTVERGALRAPRSVRYVIVALLLAALAGQVALFVFTNSSVCDEHGAHIPSGYVYLQTGVFSGGINNPPLMQLLVAAPLVLGGFDYSPFSDEGLWAARLPVLLISIALGLGVYCWAGSLYGSAAAPAALFLFCFEPNLIAHSGLATLDLGVCAALFFAFFFAWRTWRTGTARSWIAACVAMVTALLCKFTALMLLPFFVVTLVAALSREGPPARRLRRSISAVAFLCGFMIAASHIVYKVPGGWRAGEAAEARAATVTGGRALRAEARPTSGTSRADERNASLAAYEPSSSSAEGEAASALERAADALLPDLYVEGAMGKLRHSAGGHFSFLAGRRSMGGWWYYFPVALALKTPVPLLAALVISIISGRVFRGRARDVLFIFVPMICYIAGMSWTGVDIGVRHVLIFYPLAAVAASAVLAGGLPRRRAALAILGAGALWYAGGTLRISPHYLAYFNEIAGGPRGGSQYLIDSNLDWGQDDGALVRFMEEHPDTVYVNPGPFTPRIGIVAVNVNSLRGIFRGDDNAYAWLDPFEPRDTLGYTWYVYGLSIEDFERAAASSPSSPERKIWLAGILNLAGRLDDALALIRDTARTFPDRRGNALYTAGWWLLESGRFAEAGEAFRGAREAGMGDEAVGGARAAGIESKRAAGAVEPHELVFLGEFYARSDRLDAAREVLERGIAAAPGHAGLRLSMALVLGREGDYGGAAEQAAAALDIDPRSSRAAQVVGQVERILRLQGMTGSFEAQFELGRSEYRLGRPARAAKHFWNALNLNPRSQDSLAAMGEIIVRAKLGVLELEVPWQDRTQPWPESQAL